MTKWPEMQWGFNIKKSINIIHHVNRMMEETHMIISTDAEKAFDKTWHFFMIQTLNKLRIEENCLNIIKAYRTTSEQTSYSVVKDWKLFL